MPGSRGKGHQEVTSPSVYKLPPSPPAHLPMQQPIGEVGRGLHSAIHTSKFCHHDYFSVFTFDFGRKSHLRHFHRRTQQRVFVKAGHQRGSVNRRRQPEAFRWLSGTSRNPKKTSRRNQIKTCSNRFDFCTSVQMLKILCHRMFTRNTVKDIRTVDVFRCVVKIRGRCTALGS